MHKARGPCPIFGHHRRDRTYLVVLSARHELQANPHNRMISFGVVHTLRRMEALGRSKFSCFLLELPVYLAAMLLYSDGESTCPFIALRLKSGSI